MSSFTERTIKRNTIFEGNIIKVEVDEVLTPNGKTAKRELVRHPGAVAVLPLTEHNRLVVVEQFRKPLEKVIVEIPAGKLEQDEAPLQCAKRELREETGYTADKWSHLVSFYTSPGFADEEIHLYVAEHLHAGPKQTDEDEFVNVREITLDEAFHLIETKDICDAKTVAAVYAWHNRELARS